MISNILILLLVIGLVILFGWLTFRVVRARKVWVKIVGGLLAGLMTLILAAVVFMGGKGIAATYFPDVPAAPDLTVAGTSEQVARGEYLVSLSCVRCHGAVTAEGNPSEAHPLTGGWNVAEAEGFGFIGSMVTENLTPGGKLAGYSDGEIYRALRQSVNQEGHKLGFMDFLPYRELSDADTQAIVAYLRSLEPTESTVETGDKINFFGMVSTGSGIFPNSPLGAETITAPPEGITAEYGKYVATYGECRRCHGPDATGVAESAFGPAIPNPRPLVNVLTQEEFIEMMRSGVRPVDRPFPTMPWQNAAKMTDNDLAALYTYLTTEPHS
jgi:mono/diheme cytochrome c family protein